MITAQFIRNIERKRIGTFLCVSDDILEPNYC